VERDGQFSEAVRATVSVFEKETSKDSERLGGEGPSKQVIDK
jgi:hypothetical protein